MSVITIVVPVYMETENIVPFLEAVDAEMTQLTESYELIFVDDGSSDGTWDTLRTASRCRPNMRAMRLSRNFGKEAAIAAGLEIAQGDAVVVMDADLQHPPNLLPELVRLWREEHFDVVEAVKASRGQECLTYRLFARLFYSAMSRLSSVELHGASDFKLLDAKVVNKWRELGERGLFFRGLTTWLGFRRNQVPFNVTPRLRGKSGWSLPALVTLAVTGITSFSSAPLHLVTIMGAVALLMSTILGVRAVAVKLAGGAPDGITLLLIVCLFLGSIIMLSLGIIGVYIGRLFEEVKGRPRHIVWETLGFTPPEEAYRNTPDAYGQSEPLDDSLKSGTKVHTGSSIANNTA